MRIFYLTGILILIICALRGWKKGFIQMLGNVCAGILSLGFLWIMKNWALESFLGTLLFAHSVLVVRLVLCIALYIALFFGLKAVFLSLKFISKLPVIRGLDKVLGLILGGVFGVVIVGIMTVFYEWILL